MLNFKEVFYDNFIPKWRTPTEKIDYNVLVLVVQGTVVYTINEKIVQAKRGEMVFIPKSTIRGGQNHELGAHQKYTVLFNLDSNEACNLPFLNNKKFIKKKSRNFEYVKQRFEQLYLEKKGSESYQCLISKGIICELIGIFARELDNPEIAPIKLRYTQKIQNYIEENYRNNIRIVDLAKLIHRSENYTISIFKDVMGRTPITYVHQLRIIEACNLLLNTDKPIVEISNYLGYYDPAYFSRTFKRFKSMSPKDYIIQNNYPKIKNYKDDFLKTSTS